MNEHKQVILIELGYLNAVEVSTDTYEVNLDETHFSFVFDDLTQKLSIAGTKDSLTISRNENYQSLYDLYIIAVSPIKMILSELVIELNQLNLYGRNEKY